MPATRNEIINCYRILLGREPDAEGLESHVRARQPLELIVRGFVNSAEFQARLRAVHAEKIHGLEFLLPDGDRMYHAAYESHVFRPLMERMRPGITFLDVGANIGVFIIHAARRGARVIAVEALATNAQLLVENARLNGAEIELHPLAASDRHGYARLQLGESLNAAITSGDGIPVATAPLDVLVGDRSIDVIKIDVEGHEYRAMLGAARLLERSRPLVFTEYAPVLQKTCSGVSGAEYLSLFRKLGYCAWLLASEGPQPAAWDAIDERWSAAGSDHIDLLLTPVKER
jgi:FkbM family methyltransferase